VIPLFLRVALLLGGIGFGLVMDCLKLGFKGAPNLGEGFCAQNPLHFLNKGLFVGVNDSGYGVGIKPCY
jgi:hypothetical protein